MSRRETLEAAALILEAAGLSAEVHLEHTEYFVIRGAKSGAIYLAGTNLDYWAADRYASEAALSRGQSEEGFGTALASFCDDAASIAAILLVALEARGEVR